MDYSIIEFMVYGFFAYGSFLMLIISVLKEAPNTRSNATARSIYMLPGIISAIILSGTGTKIIFPQTFTNSTVLAFNASGPTLMNSTDIPVNILMNPVWIYFHGMLAAVMIIYVIFQILNIFTKVE